MSEVGIRELKQNASAVVARAAAGETVTITDRGRPVAKLIPIGKSVMEELVERGEITLPTGKGEFWKLPRLGPIPGSPSVVELLDEMREERL